MRRYIGSRDESGRGHIFVSVDEDGRQYEIIERPYPGTAGLNWGYSGSGPYNTARAILDDFLGEIPEWVGEFEKGMIATKGRAGGDFELTSAEIDDWMEAHDHH